MVMKLAASLCVIGSAAPLAGCWYDVVAPGQQGPLRLEASIGRSTLRLGDTTSILFRLRNLGADSITLTFGSSCQILPYVRGQHSGHVVYPGGGGWVCAAVITRLTLAPGAEHVLPVVVHGGAPAETVYSYVPLPPGDYLAFASLAHAEFQLRSESLAFSILDP